MVPVVVRMRRQMVVFGIVVLISAIVEILGASPGLAGERAVEESTPRIATAIATAVVTIVVRVVVVRVAIVAVIVAAIAIVIVIVVVRALILIYRSAAAVMVPVVVFLASLTKFLACLPLLCLTVIVTIGTACVTPFLPLRVAFALRQPVSILLAAFRQRVGSPEGQSHTSHQVGSEIRDAPERRRPPPTGGRCVRFLLGHVPSPGSRLASSLSWRWRVSLSQFYSVNVQPAATVSRCPLRGRGLAGAVDQHPGDGSVTAIFGPDVAQ